MPHSTHSPVGSHLIYLMSLTDKDISIWREADQLSSGLYRNNPDAIREVYTWDLRRLASRGLFKRIKKTDSLWYKLWAKSYNDNVGDKIYKSLPTIFTVSPFNHLSAEGHVFTGDFTIHPLIPNYTYNQNQNAETYNAERAIWQCMLFPGMPMLIANSIPGKDSFGPVFFSEMSLTVSGKGGLSPVNISVRFAGGKGIKSPVMDMVIPDTVPVGNTSDYQAYRTASMIDCLSSVESFTDLNELKENLAPYYELEKENPVTRLVEMQLKISQEVSFVFTGQKGRFTDEQGPRFAEIKNRRVTGTFKFFSREDKIIMGTSEINADTGALTMYFGGPFLFPMSNVEWQKPRVAEIPGEGWYHEYDFIARAANNAIQMGFRASDLPVSEFDFGSVVLDTSEDEEDTV